MTFNTKRCPWRATVCACWLTSWLIPVAALNGQDETDRTVAAVEFSGLDRTSKVFVEDLVRLHVGDRLDTQALDGAVTRLLKTGRFLSVTYDLDDREGGVGVTFKIRERTVVTSIRVEGNARFRRKQLLSDVKVEIGAPIDWFAVRDGRDAIETRYREAGYGDAVITFNRERLLETGELVYHIEEGPEVRIRKVRFEGNTVFGNRLLARQGATKRRRWIFRPGLFEEDRVESDVAALQNYYRDRGYLDARVGYRREAGKKPRDLIVVFTIAEGTRYDIENIRYRGSTVFSTEELKAMMVSQVGETVRRKQIDADARTIQSRYWELGYIDVSVRPIRVFSDRPGLVQITIEIEEGEQYRVGRVVVRGNARTKDKVVRRALNLYPPDDLFDLNEAKEAEKRLLETRIFSAARVIPVGDRPGVRDVVIDVQEAEKSGDFVFGVGVTSNSGLVGTVVLDLQNFDLFDTPRSWSEFWRFRSFFGAGQRLRIELNPGTQVNRFRIDFTEPFLFDKPLRFDTSFYFFNRGRDGYDERRVGANVSVGKRFERGRLRGWTGELAFRAESVRIDSINIFASDELRDDEGSNILTSLKGTLVRDRTDSRFLPTTGDRLRVSYEQFGILGGDFSFARLRGRYTKYKTLRTDLLDRKSVLQLWSELGVIAGNAPVFERFYAGGTGSIRGFEFRGVGERDGLDDTNIGGDFLVLMGAEYSYPLFGENVRGHFFLDTGTVGSGTYRAAIGMGIRLNLNVLGPLPLEFNLAAPIASDSDDEEQVFSFVIGRIF